MENGEIFPIPDAPSRLLRITNCGLFGPFRVIRWFPPLPFLNPNPEP